MYRISFLFSTSKIFEKFVFNPFVPLKAHAKNITTTNKKGRSAKFSSSPIEGNATATTTVNMNAISKVKISSLILIVLSLTLKSETSKSIYTPQ